MAATTVFTQTNISPPVAPAVYFFPSATGFALPAGFKSWRMIVDQSNIPADQTYTFDVEYRRAGVWTLVAGGTWFGGAIIGEDGLPTSSFVNQLSARIGNYDAQGNLVGAYPDHVRIRVSSYGGWLLPLLSMVFDTNL